LAELRKESEPKFREVRKSTDERLKTVLTIRRRFYAGWRNFESKYKLLVAAWALYDNSQQQPVLIEEGVNE